MSALIVILVSLELSSAFRVGPSINADSSTADMGPLLDTQLVERFRKWQIHDKLSSSSDGAFGDIYIASSPTSASSVLKIVDQSNTTTTILEHSLGASPEREAFIMTQLLGQAGFIQLQEYFSGEDLRSISDTDFHNIFHVSPSSARMTELLAAKRSGKVHMFFMEKGGDQWRSLGQRKQQALFPELRRLVNVMHGRGIYHLDLNENNILVDGSDVKIIDFGLAISKQYTVDNSFQDFIGRAQRAKATGLGGGVLGGRAEKALLWKNPDCYAVAENRVRDFNLRAKAGQMAVVSPGMIAQCVDRFCLDCMAGGVDC